MTDDQLELRLKDWYRTEVPTDETAPTALRAMVTAIPRSSALPGRRFASRRGVALLAAAALLTAGIGGGALLVGSGIVKPPSVSPSTLPSTAPATPTASASPGIAVDASPGPQLTTPFSSPEPCVLTGDALPPVDPVGIEGLGQIRGVYLAGRPPMVWAVNPGQDTATPIASILPDPTIDVLDISPDGSNALIRLGYIGGNASSECAGLYLVRTDGSGATRLTTLGDVPTGAFSPDGRRIAYSQSADPGTVTTLDLETGATVNQLCGSRYSSFLIDWSPSGGTIASGSCRRLCGWTPADERSGQVHGGGARLR